jgi:hypothetical protein
MPASNWKQGFQQQWDHFVLHKGKKMKHKNFYETAKEARLRLQGTVIWYDGPGEQGPYYVLTVTDHVPDGAFKIYMKAIGQRYLSDPSVYPPNEMMNQEDANLGPAMDKFMNVAPKFGVIRKDLTSPHFNNFRPFPLGMMNSVKRDKSGKALDCETLYLERQPNRLTQQGLIKSMIYISPVNAAMKKDPTQVSYQFDIWSPDFKDCIIGKYPSIDKCLSKLADPLIANESVAFHRYFALVRGPIDMLFLSYKGEIVGLLDNRNLSQITVAREHKYTREAIAELNVFKDIRGR